MKKAIFLVLVARLVFCPIQSFAQDSNSWGTIFDCAVDWFSECKVFQEKRTDKPKPPPTAGANTSWLSGKSTAANLPLPVRDVLENPSPETARAYVLWSRQASERLAKASEYVAQAMREKFRGIDRPKQQREKQRLCRLRAWDLWASTTSFRRLIKPRRRMWRC